MATSQKIFEVFAHAESLDMTVEEIRQLVYDFDDLANTMEESAEKKAVQEFEEDPATTVARENFEAIL